MLTGLSTPSAGEVLWHGKPIRDEPPNVSIVFQSFALFPWLTVFENVEAPLKARGVAAEERRKRSLKVLDTVGLDGFETAYPKELSGGMKQRVGFARALVVEPEDPVHGRAVFRARRADGGEPARRAAGAVAEPKIQTRAIFIVTHNIEEAVLLADRVIVLGKNPGAHPHGFSRRTAASARPQGARRFVEYVDYIYKVLTKPEAEPDGGDRPAWTARGGREVSDDSPRALGRDQRTARNSDRSKRAHRSLPFGRRTGSGDRRPVADRRSGFAAGVLEGRRGRRRDHTRRAPFRRGRDSHAEADRSARRPSAA